jgi:chromosome segregation ATPase
MAVQDDDVSGLKSAADSLKNVQKFNSELRKTKDLLKDAISPFESLNKISEQLLEHKTNEKKLTAEQLKNLALKVKAEQDSLYQAQEALKARKKSLENEEKSLNKLLKTKKLDADEYKKVKDNLKSIGSEINQNTEAQAKLSREINNTSGEVENLEQELEKAARSAKKLESIDKFKNTLDKIPTPMDNILNPMNLLNKAISFAINGAIEYDKRLVYRFGDTEENVKNKLYERDKVLEFEKKLSYEEQ